MRLPVSWIREYLGPSVSIEELFDTCIDLGIEVDCIEQITPNFSNVLTVEICAIEPHPKLSTHRIATAYDGDRSYKTVTSDTSCYKGMKTLFAPIGATVQNRVVKETEIEGVRSEGFFCSEAELDIGSENDRIVDLGPEASLGCQFAEEIKDSVLHLSLTPNLGHCLHVWGLAQQIAAKLNIPLKKDWSQAPKTAEEASRALLIENRSRARWEIDIRSSDAIAHYSLLAIKGVRKGRSPFHWKRRLFLSGIKPIHFVVDALNLTMLEVGQPMHAFDQRAFKGSPHVIADFGPAPKIECAFLNGETKLLSKELLLIKNGQEEPLAIGGVIGMQESAVSETTDEALIESALFSAAAVRRSSKNIDISTESSRRFERGIDPIGSVRALYICTKMMQSACPSLSIASLQFEGIEDTPALKSVSIRLSRAEAILGMEIGQGLLEETFQRLGYKYSWKGAETQADVLEVSVPAYRHDISQEIDLIEEAAKIIGFSKFNLDCSPKCRVTTQSNSQMYDYEKQARQLLVGFGLYEAITSSLIGPQTIAPIVDSPVPKNAIVSVLNPTSIDQSILRPSLLPGLLESLKNNISFKQPSVALFELGTIFLRSDGSIRERLALGILLYGKALPHSPFQENRNFDFYDAKGIWDQFCSRLQIKETRIADSQCSLYHPGRQAAIFAGSQQIGLMGEIHPKILKDLDIPSAVYFIEADLQDLLMHVAKTGVQAAPLKLYPSIERDWTVSIKKTIPYESIEHLLKKTAPSILEKIELISLFSHEKLGSDLHNVTLRCTFRDDAKTLEQQEVDLVFQDMVKKAELGISTI